MRNICSYTPIRTISIGQINDRFSTVYKAACFAAAVVVVSTDPRSNSLLTNGDSSGPGLSINGPKIRNMNNTDRVVYYRLPNNFLTNAIEAVTKSGATSTATVAAVGTYDQVAVTGGNQTSYIQLNNVNRVDNNVVARARIKVDTVGSTSCLIGLGWEGFNSSGDTGSAFHNKMYVNITSKSASAIRGSAGLGGVTTTASSGTIISNGDIIEIVYTINTIDPRLGTPSDTIVITNEKTGAYIMGSYNSIMANMPCQQSHPSIVLADGTFTILDWTFEPTVPQSPSVQFLGDSMGIGYNINPIDTIVYKTSASIPSNIVNSCGNGCYIYCMNTTGLREVLRMRPKSVLLSMYLSIYYGDFKSASPNNTIYMAAFNDMMNAIVSSGARPILITIQSWFLDNGNTADWNTFVNAQAALYPTTLILDLTSFTPTYDSSGYHYNGAFNEIVKNQLVDLMTINNLI